MVDVDVAVVGVCRWEGKESSYQRESRCENEVALLTWVECRHPTGRNDHLFDQPRWWWMFPVSVLILAAKEMT